LLFVATKDVMCNYRDFDPEPVECDVQRWHLATIFRIWHDCATFKIHVPYMIPVKTATSRINTPATENATNAESTWPTYICPPLRLCARTLPVPHTCPRRLMLRNTLSRAARNTMSSYSSTTASPFTRAVVNSMRKLLDPASCADVAPKC
jgi:hypothetical protein